MADPKHGKNASPEAASQTDPKVFRQVTVTASKASWDNLSIVGDQVNQTQDALREDKGPVEREPDKEPLLLRLLSALVTLGAAVFGTVAVLGILRGEIWPRPCVGFLICAALRGGYAYWKYRKAQQAWIERMNENAKS